MINFIEKLMYSDITDIFIGIVVAALIITGADLIVRLMTEVPISVSEFIFCLIKGLDPQQYYKENYKND